VSGEAILSEDEAFELIVYLASSAELTLLEPELYGSFRLIDAASRLLAPLTERAAPSRREFYEELKSEIDRRKVLLMSDRSAYAAFVRELPASLAAELRSRSGR
jgi:hypothetical protein